jgi:DNA primase
MRFPPSFLRELNARARLSEIIGRQVKLVRKGKEHSGCCPFHQEKTPSFTVSDVKGFYHCFGCGAHGNALNFYIDYEKLPFPEAVERLARDVGMAIPEPTPEVASHYRAQQSLEEVMEIACRYYMAELLSPRGLPARDYFRSRGITGQDAKTFRLGYAPDTRQALKAHLAQAGVPEALAVEAGLLIRPENGTPYDRFRGRVIFPILTPQQKVIAFGGRILGTGEPKYLNSPETPLFHKSSTLYGLNLARKPALEHGKVLVCEGYMDVIACHKAGLPATVAPLGTAVTEEHLHLLWGLASEPTFCFDGDNAGLKAMWRVAEMALPLIAPGTSLRFALLPKGEDPDSLVRRGEAESLRQTVTQAHSLFDTLWKHAFSVMPAETPEQRAALEAHLLGLSEKILHPALKSHYRETFRNRIWEWRKSLGGKKDTRPKTVSALLTAPSAPHQREREQRLLLAAALTYPEILATSEMEERMHQMEWVTSSLDRLALTVLEALASIPESDGAMLHEQLASHTDYRAFFSDAAAVPPPASAEDAKALWDRWYEGEQEKCRVLAEKEAIDALSQGFSEDSWQRFLALKTQN